MSTRTRSTVAQIRKKQRRLWHDAVQRIVKEPKRPTAYDLSHSITNSKKHSIAGTFKDVVSNFNAVLANVPPPGPDTSPIITGMEIIVTFAEKAIRHVNPYYRD